MQKSIWIFGGLAGILSAMLEYLFFSNEDFNANTMFVAKIAVLFICVIFGLILLRKLIGGTISIGRTIFSGLLISLIRSLVMIVAFLFLYYPSGQFYQEKVDQAFEQATLKIEADENVKPADKSMELEEIKHQIGRQYEPMGYSLLAIGSSLVSGLVISVLAAAFLSTNMMYKND